MFWIICYLTNIFIQKVEPLTLIDIPFFIKKDLSSAELQSLGLLEI